MLKKFFALVFFLVLISKPLKAGIIEINNSLLDTTKPVITHTPLGNVPKASWPVVVNCSVTDNSGIDSVWVKWYRNNTSNSKRFKLINSTGNIYSAFFNSLNSEVNIFDSIFYKIIAQDNSTNHNIDSTALFKFKILSMSPGCVGIDIVPSNYPFSTYWTDARTQLLITSSELVGLGFGTNMTIMNIAFYIQSLGGIPLNGLCISFKNTTVTTLTGFSEGGFSIGYYGNYQFTGTGRQTILMQNFNFHWDGTSNLLIEICYDNSAYTTYTTVNSSYYPGMTWGYYTDNASGCTLTGGSSISYRPNVCFVDPDKVNKTNSIFPDKYSLSQNYPNPFNPVTRIDFDIPKNGFISLRIFDILGREVRTLVNDEKSAGSYSVDFDASNLTSGVYFYKLETDGFTDVKRMVIIK